MRSILNTNWVQLGRQEISGRYCGRLVLPESSKLAHTTSTLNKIDWKTINITQKKLPLYIMYVWILSNESTNNNGI